MFGCWKYSLYIKEKKHLEVQVTTNAYISDLLQGPHQPLGILLLQLCDGAKPSLRRKMFTTRLRGNSSAWRRHLWKSKNLILDPSITTIISVQLVRESRLSGTPINNGDPKQDCLFANCNIVPLTRCYGCSPDLTLNLQLPKRMVSVRVRLEDLVTLEGSMSARIQTWM